MYSADQYDGQYKTLFDYVMSRSVNVDLTQPILNESYDQLTSELQNTTENSLPPAVKARQEEMKSLAPVKDQGLKTQHREEANSSLLQKIMTNTYANDSFRGSDPTRSGVADVPITNPVSDVVTGTNQWTSNIANRTIMNRGLLESTWENAKVHSTQAALQRWWGETFPNKDSRKVSKSDAEKFYKSLGIDVKVKKDFITEDQLIRNANYYIQKQEVESNLSYYNATRRPNFLFSSAVFAESLIGSMFSSPLDIAITGVSFLAPEAAVSTLAKAGSVLGTGLKTSKALGAIGSISRARNAAALLEAGTGESLSAADKALAGRFLKTTSSLKTISNLEYDALTALEKSGLDAGLWATVDVPSAVLRKKDSDLNGITNYNNSDMVFDILLSGALGAALPTGLRFTGQALGIMPTELRARKVAEARVDIKTKQALGEISDVVAEKQLKTLDDLDVILDKQAKEIRGVNETLVEKADELRRANVSDEVLAARYEITKQKLKKGEIPYLHELPEWETILSHLDRRLVGRLAEGAAPEDVFRDILMYRSGPKEYLKRVKIDGETGLLGSRYVAAFSEEEALEQLGNLYKAFYLKDQQALKAFSAYVKAFSILKKDLDKIYASWNRVRQHNYDPSKKRIHFSQIAAMDILGKVRKSLQDFYSYTDPEAFEKADKAREWARANGTVLPDELDNMVGSDLLKSVNERVEKTMGMLLDIKTINYKDKKSGMDVSVTIADFKKEGQDILNDMSEAIDDVAYLNNVDSVLENMSEESVQAVIKNANRFLLPEEVTLDYVFGTPRTTFDGLQKLDTDNVTWQKAVDRGRRDFDADYARAEYYDVFKSLRNKNVIKDSYYAKQYNFIKEIDKQKEAGYAEIKQGLLYLLRKDVTLSRHIQNYLSGTTTQSDYIKSAVRDAIAKSVDMSSVGALLGDNPAARSQITKKIFDNFWKEVEANPDLLTSFTDIKNLLKENRATRQVPKYDKKVAHSERRLSEIDVTADEKIQAALDDIYANAELTIDVPESIRDFNGQKISIGSKDFLDMLQPETWEAFKQADTKTLVKSMPLPELRKYIEGKMKEGAALNKEYVVKRRAVQKLWKKVVKGKYAEEPSEEAIKEIDTLQAKLDTLQKDLDDVQGRADFYDLTLSYALETFNQRALEDLRAKVKTKMSEESFWDFAKENETFNLEEATGTAEKLNKQSSIEYGRVAKDLNVLFSTVQNAVNAELSKLQVQKYHDLKVMYTKVALMMEHPESAGEILASGATQAASNHLGVRRNVEFQKRNGGIYFKDALNQLARKDLDLVRYVTDNDNYGDIIEALAYLKAGDASKRTAENSMAYRAAEVLLDEQSTLYADFTKYGSSYKQPLSLVDGSSLRYADQAISDTELHTVQNELKTSLDSQSTDLIERVDVVDGKYRYGDQFIKKEDAVEIIQELIDQLVENVDYISNRKLSPQHQKIVTWALKSFDLDKMFDSIGNSSIGYNKVADALLNGTWGELVAGDIYKLHQFVKDVKTIRRKLIGKPKEDFALGSDSWTYQFLNGFKDMTGTLKGEKSAFLDTFENTISFRTVDAELDAARRFRYKSIGQAFTQNAQRALNALFCLEQFGSEPLRITDEIRNLFVDITNKDEAYKTRLRNLAKRTGKDVSAFQLKQNQFRSAKWYIEDALGGHTQSASTGLKAARAIKTFISTGLVGKAGLKSVGDSVTIAESLIQSGLVNSRGEAWNKILQVQKLLITQPRLLKLALATASLEGDDIMRRITGDPLQTLARASENKTFADDLEYGAKVYAENCFSKLFWIEPFTNNNKNVAGLAIQWAMGEHADVPYAQLNKRYQLALKRDGVTETDWNIMRKACMEDINKHLVGVDPEASKSKFNIFNPFLMNDISDKELRQGLIESGAVKNPTKYDIDNYRRDLLRKAFSLVNISADEAISIPSERLLNNLRFKQDRGTWSEFAASAMTQYMPFGFALVANNYGRIVMNALDGLSGITAIDLLNPFNRLVKAKKKEMWTNLGAAIFSFFLISSCLIDTSVNALTTGRLELPWDTEENKPNYSWFMRNAFNSLGPIGTLLDTVVAMCDGSGIKGGSFSVQANPSASTIGRILLHQKNAWTSKKIDNHPAAAAAAGAYDTMAGLGITNIPLVSLAFQELFLAYLQMISVGGQANWDERLRRRQGTELILPGLDQPKLFGMSP